MNAEKSNIPTTAGPVRLKDIAEAVGCSVNTVSLALRDSSRVSEGMRETVRQTATELGYVANQAARHLRSQRSGMIGVYTKALYDAVRTEMVNGVLAQLHKQGYRPVLGLAGTYGGPWRESPWMQTFRELQVEAMVVVAEGGGRLPVWAARTPVVLVGCQPDDRLACDYLALDRFEAGQLGIRRVLARGCRQVAVIAPTETEFFGGASTELAQAGLQPIVVTSLGGPRIGEHGRAMGYNCGRGNPQIDAAVLGDSGVAAGFIRGMLDAGKRAPEDIAVVGYDYFPWADMLAVPLTTIEQPLEEMASAVVGMVERRLAEPTAPLMHVTQPHSLVIRESG